VGTNSSVILTIDIQPLLDDPNIPDDDAVSSIKKGYMGGTGENFQIEEVHEEDGMSGYDSGNSPNQSPNPKDMVDPAVQAILDK